MTRQHAAQCVLAAKQCGKCILNLPKANTSVHDFPLAYYKLRLHIFVATTVSVLKGHGFDGYSFNLEIMLLQIRIDHLAVQKCMLVTSK